MYRVNEVPVSIEQNAKVNLKQALSEFLNINECDILSYKIKKRSLDARKKTNIHYKYNFDVEFSDIAKESICSKFTFKTS